MGGLECNEILLTDLTKVGRLDAEYFSKENIHIENRLSHLHSSTIGEIATVVASAFYPAATQLYSIGDTPFIRCVDCISYPVITDVQEYSFEKIPLTFALEQSGIHLLHKGDIVITKVGTPCFASVVNDYETVALSRTVLGLKNIDNIDPYYLMAFLRSKFGFEQLMRQRELTIQYQLTLDRVKSIMVYLASERFQTAISNVVKDSLTRVKESKEEYDAAEDFLLEQINVDTRSLSTDNVSIKSFSESFEQTGRLDAEYYQRKYEELIASIQSAAYGKLQDIVDISKSIEPGSEAYCDEGIPFIRISDFSKYGFSSPDKYLEPGSDYDLPELYLKKDEILFSKDGSIGIAYKVEQDMKAITSGALLHFRIKNGIEILPDYLTAVLNSDIVRLQAERDAGGSIINHWKPSEIEEVLIPILTIDKQQAISDKIVCSFDLRRKSERLLDAAKQAVEMAIEQCEDDAVTWLNKTVSDI